MTLTAADASTWAGTLLTLATVLTTLRAQDRRPTPRDERKLRAERDKARAQAAASRRREELADRRARAAEAQLRQRGAVLTDQTPAVPAWPRGTGRRRLPTGALPVPTSPGPSEATTPPTRPTRLE